MIYNDDDDCFYYTQRSLDKQSESASVNGRPCPVIRLGLRNQRMKEESPCTGTLSAFEFLSLFSLLSTLGGKSSNFHVLLPPLSFYQWGISDFGSMILRHFPKLFRELNAQEINARFEIEAMTLQLHEAVVPRWIWMCVFARACVWMYVCMWAHFVSIYICASEHVCWFICLFACMLICMYVCMYVFIIHTHVRANVRVDFHAVRWMTVYLIITPLLNNRNFPVCRLLHCVTLLNSARRPYPCWHSRRYIYYSVPVLALQALQILSSPWFDNQVLSSHVSDTCTSTNFSDEFLLTRFRKEIQELDLWHSEGSNQGR